MSLLFSFFISSRYVMNAVPPLFCPLLIVSGLTAVKVSIINIGIAISAG